MQVDELVKKFADAVARQAAARDPSVANRQTRAYVAAFEELIKHGDRGRDALASLLEDERAEVRVMVGAFLLRHCEQKARAVLEAEAKGEGLTALRASQALARWEDGTWELDP